MRTYVATPATRERNWLVVDATNQRSVAWRRIAGLLRGAQAGLHAHVDVGDFVIVVNADRISVTGRKREQKRYYRHSGYPADCAAGRWARCSTAGRRR